MSSPRERKTIYTIITTQQKMQIQLDPWQLEVINDKHKYILICKGRQIGGTTVLAHKAVKWMLEKKSRILVGSITEDQAKLVIIMVLQILESIDKRLIKGRPTQDRINLKNGAEIRSRPVGTLGDGFRGFTADVNWLNEVAAWPELALIAIMPTLMTTGGEIWADSTPKGKYLTSGDFRWFYRVFLNKDGRWKVYYKNSKEVILNRQITDYWTAERREASLQFLKDQEKEMNSLLFGQEYLGLFQEDILQFFDDELIEELSNLQKRERKEGKHYLAADIGGAGTDPSVIVVGHEDNGIMRQTEMQSMTSKFTTEVTDRILQLKRIWKTRKEYIDGAGVGWGVYSELKASAECMNTVENINSASKSVSTDDKKRVKILQSDLYHNLKRLMERRKIYFLNDDNLKASLRGIQRIVDNNGREHFVGRDNHITEALTRLGWAMHTKSLNLWAAWS